MFKIVDFYNRINYYCQDFIVTLFNEVTASVYVFKGWLSERMIQYLLLSTNAGATKAVMNLGERDKTLIVIIGELLNISLMHSWRL